MQCFVVNFCTECVTDGKLFVYFYRVIHFGDRSEICVSVVLSPYCSFIAFQGLALLSFPLTLNILSSVLLSELNE